MRRGSERPDNQIERVTDPRAEAIDEPAGEQETDSVRESESCADFSILSRAPSHFFAQQRCENAQNRTVDIVDGCREKQERADPPSDMPDPGCCLLSRTNAQARSPSILRPTELFQKRPAGNSYSAM